MEEDQEGEILEEATKVQVDEIPQGLSAPF